MAAVRRAFVDVEHGQAHLRRAGAEAAGRRPLVMLHASPGSSKQLERLIEGFGETRLVVAPDMPGNGDSTPLPETVPTIADLAEATVAVIDRLGLGRVDLYGSHTGASLAMEIAIARPERVGRLILDGMGLYSEAEQADILAHYAPEVAPDLNGSYLMWAWHFCRDQYLFWPWFRRDTEHARDRGLPEPPVLHDRLVEVLKALGTYHRTYRAAFRHPKRERLPLLTVPTLAVAARDDMLFVYLEELARLVPGGRSLALPGWEGAADREESLRRLTEFLDES